MYKLTIHGTYTVFLILALCAAGFYWLSIHQFSYKFIILFSMVIFVECCLFFWFSKSWFKAFSKWLTKNKKNL